MSEGNGYTCDCTETGYYGTDCEHGKSDAVFIDRQVNENRGQ